MRRWGRTGSASSKFALHSVALQLHLQGQPLRADPSADLRRSQSIQRAAADPVGRGSVRCVCGKLPLR